MKPILKKETIILTIQNGVTNREDLKKEIDKGHVLEGYTNIGIEVESPGTLKHSYKGGIIFGGEDTDAIVKFQEILNKSEIVNTVEDNIKKELWKKFLWNSTFNMLTAAINVTVDALFKDERSSKLVDDLLSEIISIADSEGIELGEEERSQALMTAKAVGSYVTSTLNDVRRHKKLEIDTFTGHLVELAKKNNVEAPINNILYAELKAVEAQINFK
jgi:2-dehydropantoate 2-reductase